MPCFTWYKHKEVANENDVVVNHNDKDEIIENVALELDNILSIVSFSLTTQIRAIKIKEEYKLQFYDSLIIATALENNCNILYSEDMHHGQIIENSLKIINPFESNYE